MSTERPIDVARVLEQAHSAVAAGKLVTEYDDEAAPHAPLPRKCAEPVQTDSSTEASLRERLGVGVPQHR